jgi:hypothetical protein
MPGLKQQHPAQAGSGHSRRGNINRVRGNRLRESDFDAA